MTAPSKKCPSTKRGASFEPSELPSSKVAKIERTSTTSSLSEPCPMDDEKAGEGQEGPACTILDCSESKVRDMLASGTATAMYIHEFEWISLMKGSNGLLRSFKTRDHEILLVMKKDSGHVVVGCLTVVACNECSNVRLASKQLCHNSYPNSALTSLRAGKAYRWDVKDVVQFGQGCTLQWVGQRHKNRTFKITGNIARFQLDATPKEQTLSETAKFILSNFTVEQQEAVKAWAASMNNGCIRVGTTCSGTDICIAVLKQTVAYINEVEAGYHEFLLVTLHNRFGVGFVWILSLTCLYEQKTRKLF